MSDYKALVCKVASIVKHPNADRLQIATVAGGFEVIVGLETKLGDLGVYFDTDGQLSDEFLKANNLYARKNPDGTRAGGFFDERRRVRAQKFRGVKSDGFWVPLSYFEYCVTTPDDWLVWKEGMTFNEVKGHPICNKYITERTRKSTAASVTNAQNKKDYKHYRCLHRHIDTAKLKAYVNVIPKGALIVISIKEHGTSAVTGYVPVEKDLTLWQRLINKVWKTAYPTKEYTFVVGTRNVVMRNEGQPDGYYADTFRWTAANNFRDKLRKGETVYYEIVGYDSRNQPLMGTHDISKLKKDYKGTNQFKNKQMVYSYGCMPGEHRVKVYRITMTNEDGQSFDLSTEQCEYRCKELEVPFVKVVERFFYDGDQKKLFELCEKYMSEDELKPSLIDPSHIEEGVVLRVETGAPTPEFYKHKSFIFMVLEDHWKEKEDNVDLEEAS